MDIREQTLLWANGQSVHNRERDECCPDFSCCTPELLASAEVRDIFLTAYLKGNHKVMDRMLMEFLGKLVTFKFGNGKVHIAGLEESRQEMD